MYVGTAIDLFRGKAASREDDDEKFPTKVLKTIKVRHGVARLPSQMVSARSSWAGVDRC